MHGHHSFLWTANQILGSGAAGTSRVWGHSQKKKKKEISYTCNGNTAETRFFLDGNDIGNSMARRQDNGINNETIFKLLDLTDHVSLFFGRAVMMNNTNTTKQL